MRLFALFAAALAAAPAVAQIPPPRDAGATPAAEAPAPRAVTETGQTKPPGTAEGPGLGTRPDLEAKSRELSRKIDTGICRGCD